MMFVKAIERLWSAKKNLIRCELKASWKRWSENVKQCSEEQELFNGHCEMTMLSTMAL